MEHNLEKQKNKYNYQLKNIQRTQDVYQILYEHKNISIGKIIVSLQHHIVQEHCIFFIGA